MRSPNIKNVHREQRVGVEAVLTKILPVYQRLVSDTMHERCLMCLTQNANESLHSVIWRHCRKESFGSKHRVELAVEQALCKFNAGTTKAVAKIQTAAGLATGHKTIALSEGHDRKR